MRKYYLDNLRIIAIFLLFPFHTLMIWNDFGSKFYIWENGNKFLSSIIVLINPWFMPLLFVIAGISAKFSLEKRTEKQFLIERTKKLFIPFLIGLIFLVPIQTFFARKWFFDYKGNFFDNLKYFFTHFTDFSGYDGCFSPSHFWFILFLFIIYLIFIFVKKNLHIQKIEEFVCEINVWYLFLFFIPITLFYFIGNFGGFSLGKSFILFFLGYCVLSNEKILQSLMRKFSVIVGLFVFFQVTLVFLYYKFNFYGDFFVNFVSWIGILSILLIGKKYLNQNTTFTKYFNTASFYLYFFHQSFLVVLAYFIIPMDLNFLIKFFLIMCGTFIFSILCYEIFHRILCFYTLNRVNKKVEK